MCGRYTVNLSAGRDGVPDPKLAAIAVSLERRFPGACKTGEIVPGDTAPALIAAPTGGAAGSGAAARAGDAAHTGNTEAPRIVAVPAVFGLVGFDGKLLINARSETAAAKPTFAESLRERRMILPACGFFEWSRDVRKTKYLFTPESGAPAMYLCGLYRAEADGRLHFAILTRAANTSIADVHDRMPVIIGEDEVRAYLTDAAAAARILAEAAPALMRAQA